MIKDQNTGANEISQKVLNTDELDRESFDVI